MDGRQCIDHGDPVPRAELPAVLADPDTWDDPSRERWYGECTLDFTEAGYAETRRRWAAQRAAKAARG